MLVWCALPYAPVAEVFAAFAAEPMALLLDSQTGKGLSYIAVQPRDTLRLFPGTADPLALLAARLNSSPTAAHDPALPPFQTGWAGYIAYETGYPRIKVTKHTNTTAPWIELGYYDVVAAYSHDLKQAWLIWQRSAASKAATLKEKLLSLPRNTSPPVPPPTLVFSSPGGTSYKNQVSTTRDYIHAGDIYQANIALMLQAAVPKHYPHYAAYGALRQAHPAPYAAYMYTGSTTILSSSPELFLSSDGVGLLSKPIKGTAPIDADPAALARDPKNRAENLMIVDLLRNDMAQSCRPGSVVVSSLCALETHPTVHHLVSTISGQLKLGTTAADAFCAAFPGGSITGAPKIRAMQIIAELEELPRHVYCGSIAYFSVTGAHASSIAIRTVVFRDAAATLYGGSGITAGSNPDDEYAECLTKIAGLRAVLERSAAAPYANAPSSID